MVLSLWIFCNEAWMKTIYLKQKNIEWVGEEFGRAKLGDLRLTGRLMKLAKSMAKTPEASIAQATGVWKDAKGAYRFFDNEKVTMKKVLATHQEETLKRMNREKVVLAVQDTTVLNLSGHECTEGLGPIGTHEDGARGFILHTTLAFDNEGKALGIIDAECWARKAQEFGKSHRRQGRKLEEKESYKWLKSFEVTQELQKQLKQTQVVVVADREADFYDLLAKAGKKQGSAEILVRCCYNRRLSDSTDSRLWEVLCQQPASGQLEIEVPRQKGRKARQAQLTVRFREVILEPAWQKQKLGPLKLWAILVEECNPPEGVEPLCWRLLTTIEIHSLQDALEKIQWYRLRWQIEVYHKILKTGCRIEEYQLQTLDRLTRVLGIALVIAWRILLMSKVARQTPAQPATQFIEETQWKMLYLHFNPDVKLPTQAPPIKQILIWIAQLGGFLARKNDGFPGAQTLWKGFQKLNDLTCGYELFQTLQKCG